MSLLFACLKRALKDLSIYCTFIFSVYLLVKLFTLPPISGLVNKDLQLCQFLDHPVCISFLFMMSGRVD